MAETSPRPTQVIITVDTERSPGPDAVAGEQLRANLVWSTYGGIEGRYGLPYQLDIIDSPLPEGGIFTEALCADVVGGDTLAEVVSLDARPDGGCKSTPIPNG